VTDQLGGKQLKEAINKTSIAKSETEIKQVQDRIRVINTERGKVDELEKRYDGKENNSTEVAQAYDKFVNLEKAVEPKQKHLVREKSMVTIEVDPTIVAAAKKAEDRTKGVKTHITDVKNAPEVKSNSTGRSHKAVATNELVKQKGV